MPNKKLKTIQIGLTPSDYEALAEYASKLERTPANLVKHWVLTAMIGKGLVKNKTLEDLKNEKS
jgi:hypothetical protein